jgi:hypothetical protein
VSENIARTPREGLDQQIAELAALRNAGTRAPSFRAWRQATLTLLQRIWSNDPSVSERFRRVPFSPNHNRADANELRNVYEKGCAEAMTVLKDLRDRIGDMPWASIENAGHADSFEVGSTEDDFPTLDLPPGNGGRPPSTSRHPAKRKTKSKPAPARGTNLSDLLREAESKGTQPGAPALPLAESRVLPPDPAAPPPRSKGRRMSPGAKKKDRLKDMLGFMESGKDTDRPEVRSTPVPPPAPEAPAAFEPPAVTPAVSHMPPVPAAPITGMPPVPPAPPMGTRTAGGPPPLTPQPVLSTPPAAPGVPAVPSDLLREMEIPEADVPSPAAPALEPPEAASSLPPAAAAPAGAPPAAAPPAAAPPAAAPPAGAATGSPPSHRAASLNEMLMTPDFTAKLESFDHDTWSSPDVPGPEELEQGLPPQTPVTPPRPASAQPRPKASDIFTAFEAFGSPEPAPLPPLDPSRPVAPPAVAHQPVVLPPTPAQTPPVKPGPPSLEPAAAEPLDPERVTEEFFRNSPVLTSMGTPVRRKDAEPRSGSLVPEAIQILEIASRTHELGVPESRRAHARAYLAELARSLETRELTWESLRDTVQFLMEFPPLARRVLPLILPFFDQAA